MQVTLKYLKSCTVLIPPPENKNYLLFIISKKYVLCVKHAQYGETKKHLLATHI